MNRIAEVALSLAGTEFRPGVPEQCMNFVRHVLTLAGHPLADQVTKAPVDGHWTGISLASSLAGRDLGPIIVKPSELQPGDICFWEDTYPTGFPPHTITHVGIYVGNDQIVHRPTKAAPVRQQSFSGYAPSLFRCALRPGPIPTSSATTPNADPPKPASSSLAGQPTQEDPPKWQDLDSLEIVAKFGDQTLKIAGHSGKLKILVP